MSDNPLRQPIERGDVAALRRVLESDPGLANRPIRWVLNRENESDPLHYVSDCVGQGWLTNGAEAAIAELLVTHGAAVDGVGDREPPLIGAASLGVEPVSRVLIEAGAGLEATATFGARALHWAAWMGTPDTVRRLLVRGAEVGPRDAEFGATPLFWAVQGLGPKGPSVKRDQVGAARALIEAGASVTTKNRQGLSALGLAKGHQNAEMYELLRQHASGREP